MKFFPIRLKLYDLGTFKSPFFLLFCLQWIQIVELV